MKTRCLALAYLLVAWTSYHASAATVSLLPAKDNTIMQQTNPATQLSNGLGDLFSGRTNQDPSPGPAIVSIRRSMVNFDIASAIPSGKIIKSVQLTMRDVMGNNGNRVTSLHRALADWGEGTSFFGGGVGAPSTQNDASWLYRFYNAANPAASPTWATPGGDYASTASGATTILGGNPNGNAYNWTGAGMVADVQSWLDNPSGNFGWFIIGDESIGQTAKRLVGRTTQNVPNSTGPVLVVTYVPEPGTIMLALIASFGTLVVRRRLG